MSDGEPGVISAAPPAAARSRLFLLALIGIAAASLYFVGLALRYPLLEGIWQPRHNWARLVGGATVPALLLHLAVYVAAILLYMLAMRLVLNHKPATRRAHRQVIAVIVGSWLLASLALLAVAPGGEAHDIFDYLFRGRMVAELGASPLADPPELFPDQPFYAYITWTDFVDAYGPLWEIASGAVAAATHALLVATGRWYDGAAQCPDSAAACFMLTSYVLAYRSLAVLLAGLCGWLIYAITARQSPPLERAALLVWLWNPLLLVSSAVGAHNDMVMLLFVLASFWSLQRRWWLAALLLLVLAAHVKLTALTLAPLYGLWLVRQLGWRRALAYAAVTALLGLALSWLLYAPFGGWATLPRMLEERQRYVALSPHHVLYRVLYELGWDAALTRNLTIHWPTYLYLVGSVLISGALGGWRRADPLAVRTGDLRVFWRAATVVNLFYLLVGSFWFQPWYVLWVLAPAALLPQSRFTHHVLPWLCAGALSSNVIADYLPQLPGPPLARTGRVIAAVTTTWLPAVLAALLVWRKSLVRWRRLERR
jgi:hypothetical protein